MVNGSPATSFIVARNLKEHGFTVDSDDVIREDYVAVQVSATFRQPGTLALNTCEHSPWKRRRRNEPKAICPARLCAGFGDHLSGDIPRHAGHGVAPGGVGVARRERAQPFRPGATRDACWPPIKGMHDLEAGSITSPCSILRRISVDGFPASLLSLLTNQYRRIVRYGPSTRFQRRSNDCHHRRHTMNRQPDPAAATAAASAPPAQNDIDRREQADRRGEPTSPWAALPPAGQRMKMRRALEHRQAVLHRPLFARHADLRADADRRLAGRCGPDGPRAVRGRRRDQPVDELPAQSQRRARLWSASTC